MKLEKNYFAKIGRSLENIPPTQDALAQHLKPAIYQSSIWSVSPDPQCVIPTPSDWGWELKDNTWVPVWITLPVAAKSCNELIKCSCKASKCTRCKCAKASLNCTDLCKCKCLINVE